MIRFKIKVNMPKKKKQDVLDKGRRVLYRSMFKMEELAILKAPTDEGELRSKISVAPEILANRYVLTSAAGHSEAMEYGTRPFYAPIDPLKSWAGRKLGDQNLGYAVRAKIAKFGITAQPFMRPSYHEVINFWYPIFKKEEFSK